MHTRIRMRVLDLWSTTRDPDTVGLDSAQMCTTREYPYAIWERVDLRPRLALSRFGFGLLG